MTARQPTASEFFAQLEAEPYAYDVFQALRRIECLFSKHARLGEALRPIDEPIRLGQAPSTAFAVATICAFVPQSGRQRAPRLEVAFLGLLGPNGPLPLHLTEFAHERLTHAGDAAFARFLDLFNHRFLAFFYRAWAQAQPTVSLDRPQSDRFASYVGSMLGLGTPQTHQRDALPDHAKLFFAGLLARQARNADGLAAALTVFFSVPVRIEEFVGHWIVLPDSERTRLGIDNESALLGRGAVVGGRVWDRQSKFRVWLGPLTFAQYQAFLPGGAALVALVAWVRQYLHGELEWDARLELMRAQIPEMRLARGRRLGWDTWLGWLPGGSDAADLTLDAERLVAADERAIATRVSHG